jgi:hypothetical protein
LDASVEEAAVEAGVTPADASKSPPAWAAATWRFSQGLAGAAPALELKVLAIVLWRWVDLFGRERRDFVCATQSEAIASAKLKLTGLKSSGQAIAGT